jgi:hypothetical protein
LEIMVLYEDRETALRARHSLEMFLPDVGEAGEPLFGLWKIDLLRDSLLRERAAVEAAAADIIIISLHRADRVRPEFWDWMRRWQERRVNADCAFGVLLDSMPLANHPERTVLVCIERLAKAAGADFFSGASPTCTLPEVRPWVQDHAQSLSPPASHWGINE